MKKYLEKNVYDAAQERLNYLFDEFETIYVSFSSGKDSGSVLNMCIDIARKRKRKIYALFIDLEAWYKKSIEYVEKMFSENEDVLIPLWICLPMQSPNGLSNLEPVWTWWDESKKDVWVRDMPKNKWVINQSNNIFDWYNPKMTFEIFIKHIGKTLSKKNEKVCCIVGIRADESLHRYLAVAKDNKVSTYKNKKWLSVIDDITVNAYPIYDWTVEDIWTYYGKYNKPYNYIYDLYYKAGIPIRRMRIDEPFGNEAKAGLNQFRVIEPETWARVVNRVSGANFGVSYKKNLTISKPPCNYTWKQFTEFLISTLPDEISKGYKEKFQKFITYWQNVGCPVPDECMSILETKYKDKIINTHKLGTRGNKDKPLIKFKEVLDEIPEIEGKSDFCTYKRMAMCILKSDFVCKGLSFGISKKDLKRRKELLEKYKNL